MKKSKLFISLILSTLLFSLSGVSQAKGEKLNKSASVTQNQSVAVNVNSDDAEKMAKNLKGIGLKKAQAIVAYRNKNGKFKALNDLKAVKGIGDATLAKNKALIKL